MGRSSNNGGVIIFVPGGRGQPAETIGATRAKRGETLGDTVRRALGGQRAPGGARVLDLSGEDIANYGGGTGFGRDADINDILGAGAAGRRIVAGARPLSSARRSAGRLASEETRAAARERNAPRRAARAAQQLANLRAEQRAANARVRQLREAGRSARTIRTAELAANRLRDQVREAARAARG